MRNYRSVIRGIKAMHSPLTIFRYWAIGFIRFGLWLECWTPTWHAGRGPYISAGIGWLYITRGY